MKLILRSRFGQRLRHVLLGSGGRGEIRLNRFFPQTQPRKNVRWHVERMRRRRSDFRVGPSSGQGKNRKLGRIVAVDQVVSDTGMVWLLWQDTI